VYAWDSCRICFTADGKERYALASSHEHLFEICNVVLRLLAARVVQSVILETIGVVVYGSTLPLWRVSNGAAPKSGDLNVAESRNG
jgi:hypothetical protein